VVIEAPNGARLAYTGDTGPSETVAQGHADADLLLVEAALTDPRFDDLERGHLTPEEALDFARVARARAAMLVHYGPARRPDLEAMCRDAGPWARAAIDGMTMTVDPAPASSPAVVSASRDSPD
jgi:ribonuclease BN (tRNA processing enzyme)